MSAVSRCPLTHLSDAALMRELPRLAAAERTSTAALLAALAEADTRGAFASMGYPSMHAYRVRELKLAPDVADKRIQAARAVREFPALLAAVEDGRLTITTLLLLAPQAKVDSLDELIAAAAGRTKRDVTAILAHRIATSGAAAASALAADVTERSAKPDPDPVAPSNASEPGEATVPLSALVSGAGAAATPVPVRFPLHLAVTQAFRDKLAYARDLLAHAVPAGDAAEVLERALDSVIEKIEKRRFGVGARSRPARRTRGTNERAIPLAVRREVFRRDGGLCTFVGENGHRCESSHRLQFDHIVPVARGGQTTASNLRLRCHTHNRVEAERAFGKAFMQARRERAKQEKQRGAPAPAWQPDVFAALRALGFRKTEAHSVLTQCDLGPDATLEQRVRTALQHLAPPGRKEAPAA